MCAGVPAEQVHRVLWSFVSSWEMKEWEQLPLPQGRLQGGRGLAPVGAESQSA